MFQGTRSGDIDVYMEGWLQNQQEAYDEAMAAGDIVQLSWMNDDNWQSGFTVPTYVIDAPGGGGKIPVMPNYLISWSTNKVVLRNYEGVITTYKEPDSYEPLFCDRNCDDCELQLRTEDAHEMRAVGIDKLLSDYDKSIALIPNENVRHERRDKS